MSWKRRWSILGVLTLAQVGVVICYQGFLKGTAAPASPPAERQIIASGPPAPPPAPTQMPPQAEHAIASKAGLAEIPPVAVPVPERAAEPPPLTLALVDSTPSAPLSPVKGNEEKVVPVAATEVVPGERLKPVAVESQEPGQAPNGGSREFTRPMGTAVVQAAPPAPQTPSLPPPVSPLIDPLPKGVLPSTPAPLPSQPEIPAPAQKSPPVTPPPAVAPQTQEPPSADLTTCPWVLRVEIVKGRTLMTAQTGKDVQFRVSCDKLELQAPRGSILACGNVSVSSEGLQGSCDQLTIAWQKDQVVLEGRAELKCHRDGQEVDLKAAKLSLRLSVPHKVEDVTGRTIRSQKPRPRPVAPMIEDREERNEREVPASWSQPAEQAPPADGEARGRKKSIRMPEID